MMCNSNKKTNILAQTKDVYIKAVLSMLILHLIYAIMFYFAGSFLSVVYNIISIVIYTILLAFAGNSKYAKICFTTCFAEMIIFSGIEVIMCGYDSGFTFYFIGIVSLTAYLVYMLYEDIQMTLLSTLIEIIYFVIITIINFMNPGFVFDFTENWHHIIYIVNMTLCLLMLVSFVIIFTARSKQIEITLQRENRKLESAANYDPLTKLLNRRTFDHYFAEAIHNVTENGQDFTVVMIDIDNFKGVNDTYGHDAGDDILKNVALMLKYVVRPYDTIFRWGGEEIVLLLSANKTAACDVAKRCCQKIENFVLSNDGHDIKVTITAGVCPYTAMDTKDSIIEKADEALYYGKNHGKNQVVLFSAAVHAASEL